MFYRIILYLFPLIKEIKSQDSELHFRRWRIIETPWFNIYIHTIYQSDKDLHPHNHPFSYITIPLINGYLEESVDWVNNTHIYYDIEGSWFNYRFWGWYHKIMLWSERPATTLVLTSGRNHGWGYLVNDIHVDHKEYRKLKNEGKLNAS